MEEAIHGSEVATIPTAIRDFDPAELKLLEVNARFMRHEQFQLLVNNIKRDGELTSVPFAAVNEDGTYTVLSGNHRVQAAIEAGLTKIRVMVTDVLLDDQRKLALQLSHNSIAGEDDPSTLRRLYEELTDVDLMVYSGLDDKDFGLLGNTEALSFSEPSLNFRAVSFLFLPEEIEYLKEVFEKAKSYISGNELWLAKMSEYDSMLDSLCVSGQSYGVTNVATSLMVLMQLVESHLDDLTAGWLDEDGELTRKNGQWVPLASIFGNDQVPAESGKVIKQALDKMVGADDVSKKAKWLAIEYWAAEYLNS